MKILLLGNKKEKRRTILGETIKSQEKGYLTNNHIIIC